MEVGAVKQAFNDEVILLKKKLNQAKIQIIHKLIRKAKQLNGKKAPEHLNEKFKRKAQTAVNEVLIIKKIKPKDIAKFIVTHKGELKDFLNKPTVDNDKACARLLLHKALQNKYNFIRGRFSNVSIQDLFMSRLERRKVKKEAKENQKNKKKGKDNKVINSEGDWNVEDVIMPKLSDSINDRSEISGNDDNDVSVSDNDDRELSDGDDSKNDEFDVKLNKANAESEEDINNSEEENEESDVNNESEDVENEEEKPTHNLQSEDENSQTIELSSHLKQAPIKQLSKVKPKEVKIKKPERKQKEINKLQNFNEKILQKKLKKDADEPILANKIVDPFFITSTGENYMSVVEPRGPDEIKDEHKQGNRKLRRAAMFGHVPNIKPRHNGNIYMNDNRFSHNSYGKGNRFNSRQDFDNKRELDDRQEFSNRKSFNNDFNDRNRFNERSIDEKPEKLHPSWEAKKKKSGLLPFEGKKIVFD